ncbi:helix-turn-helix domain-containing protein [Gracilibacillus xinjiangensis]|uniref:Helix-turn-helix domain-containing protein n=1 Tax=Gracilibacillus xinjiangensis TaxID=1193282 RepID=A0ABV8WWS1_9BACI
MLKYILLYCIDALRAERSVANVYYLLRGKKSTQTIQDSHLYNLTNFFGVYRTIKRKDFNRVVDELVKMNLIKISEQGFAHMNEYGKEYLVNQYNKFQHLYLKGMSYEKSAPQFLATLILLIQTVTNIHMKNYRFIPVIDDVAIQSNVKRFLQSKQLDMTILLKDLYDDLLQILSSRKFPEYSKDIFVDYITSANEVGLGQQQLAVKYNISKEDIHCYLMNMIHLILEEIRITAPTYKVLPYILDQKRKLPLTESAIVTYKYYSSGYTIHEIANQRNLKESTVQDHIIEIAYMGEVKWSNHMNDKEFSLIREVLEKSNTKQLKTLKDQLPDFITYFQIKLVIALWHKNC